MKKIFIFVIILAVIVLVIIGYENRWDEKFKKKIKGEKNEHSSN